MVMPKTAENNSTEAKNDSSFFTAEEKALILARREAMKGLEHVKSVGYLIVAQCTRRAKAYRYEGKDYPETIRLDMGKLEDLLTKAGGKYRFSKMGWKSGGELKVELVDGDILSTNL